MWRSFRIVPLHKVIIISQSLGLLLHFIQPICGLWCEVVRSATTLCPLFLSGKQHSMLTLTCSHWWTAGLRHYSMESKRQRMRDFYSLVCVQVYVLSKPWFPVWFVYYSQFYISHWVKSSFSFLIPQSSYLKSWEEAGDCGLIRPAWVEQLFCWFAFRFSAIIFLLCLKQKRSTFFCCKNAAHSLVAAYKRTLTLRVLDILSNKVAFEDSTFGLSKFWWCLLQFSFVVPFLLLTNMN